MSKDRSIFIAGHNGMVGSALQRGLRAQGYRNLITRDRKDVDLCNADQVDALFRDEPPQVVIMAAAWVGGIQANIDYPVEALEVNLRIQANTFRAAARHGASKLVFIGSSCMYPRSCPQPMGEDMLLSGPPEPTNEGYALAKLAGWKLAEAYQREYGLSTITTIPCNMYGPKDNFSLESGHVIAALIRRFHEAKETDLAEVRLWGTGTARREFLHVDDNAEATIFLLERPEVTGAINVGSGADLTIKELSRVVAEVVGYEGEIQFPGEGPDGMPRKLLDNKRIHQLGWHSSTGLRPGIEQTYRWFLENAYSPGECL